MYAYYDSAYHQQLRLELVEELKKKQISDEDVLHAIAEIPRHLFADFDTPEQAYTDKAYRIGKGQTISQPYTVAFQTQLLELSPHDEVLEIGTGSGYQTSILAMIAGNVFTIERQKELFDEVIRHPYFQNTDNIHFFYGDGFEGLPDHGPFDRILITAAPPSIPLTLVSQLKPDGIMVLPVGDPPLQRMVKLRLLSSGEVLKEYFSLFSFVPMLKGKQP
jgi:protein-L-isoaspartate(D-aspartate) O-methyltransferase